MQYRNVQSLTATQLCHGKNAFFRRWPHQETGLVVHNHCCLPVHEQEARVLGRQDSVRRSITRQVCKRCQEEISICPIVFLLVVSHTVLPRTVHAVQCVYEHTERGPIRAASFSPGTLRDIRNMVCQCKVTLDTRTCSRGAYVRISHVRMTTLGWQQCSSFPRPPRQLIVVL